MINSKMDIMRGQSPNEKSSFLDEFVLVEPVVFLTESVVAFEPPIPPSSNEKSEKSVTAEPFPVVWIFSLPVVRNDLTILSKVGRKC